MMSSVMSSGRFQDMPGQSAFSTDNFSGKTGGYTGHTKHGSQIEQRIIWLITISDFLESVNFQYTYILIDTGVIMKHFP